VLQPVVPLGNRRACRGRQVPGPMNVLLECSLTLLLPAALPALPSVVDRKRSVIVGHGALAPWESGEWLIIGAGVSARQAEMRKNLRRQYAEIVFGLFPLSTGWNKKAPGERVARGPQPIVCIWDAPRLAVIEYHNSQLGSKPRSTPARARRNYARVRGRELTYNYRVGTQTGCR
jgi:hypothetical protein